MPFSAPVINDVTTDLENPPGFRKANIGGFPESFKAIVAEGYPELKTLFIKGKPPSTAFPAAVSAARKMSRWEITLEDEAAGIIEVSHHSVCVQVHTVRCISELVRHRMGQ